MKLNKLLLAAILLMFISTGVLASDQQSVKYVKGFKSQTIIPTLMYHHFVKVGEQTSGTTITKEAFKEQMVYLKSKGYNTISDQDMFDFYYNGKELPPNPVHITMDDGYESNYEFAYPILKENNMKATIFKIVERAKVHPISNRLTWAQMKEMSDSGVMSIQSHTYDLHHKEIVNSVEKSAMVAKDNYEHHKKVKEDLLMSRKVIESKLGKPVTSLAYPYGHYNEKIMLDAKESGIKIAYTVAHGVNNLSTNPLKLNRINVTPEFNGEKIHKEIIKQKKLLKSRK